MPLGPFSVPNTFADPHRQLLVKPLPDTFLHSLFDLSVDGFGDAALELHHHFKRRYPVWKRSAEAAFTLAY